MSHGVVHPALVGSRPLAIAHRGGSALMPENTLAAFDHATALGVDAVELDVRLARDGTVVVHHDATLDRTTDATGPLARFTAAELERVDAAWHFGSDAGFPERDRGYGVPRLQTVIERYPEMPFIVELKGQDPRLAVAAVGEARELAALDRLCFGGFARATLLAARALGEDVATSATRNETRWALYRSRLGLAPSRPAYRAFQVPEMAGRTRVVSARFVAAVHRAGIPVQVWTVDTEADMRRLLALGVDGLISDRPDVAVPTVRAMAASPLSLEPVPGPSRATARSTSDRTSGTSAADLGRRDSRG